MFAKIANGCSRASPTRWRRKRSLNGHQKNCRALLFIAKYIIVTRMRFRIALGSAAVFLAACSHSNNLLLGRVENRAGAHQIVVTDCYRTSVPQPEALPNATWHYAPCR